MGAKNVIFGALGTEKDDRGTDEDRWDLWRPTVDLCMNTDFPVSRYELFHQKEHSDLALRVKADIEERSKTKVRLHLVDFKGGPWNFESVYVAFFDFFHEYRFDHDNVEYFVNISTGTHVMQICLFLLAEAKFVPARLVQSTGDRRRVEIDLRLEKFDLIAQRFRKQEVDDIAYLKDDIDTKNADYEKQIRRILAVSTNYDYPILLTGRTGVGKTTLAKRIHELRARKNASNGEFVAVNCGTLGGDVVRSELFGHTKGSFTGAEMDQMGLLEKANHGTLFLDEIGELSPDVQKMLLTAIEDKKFRSVGGKEIASDFYFIAGTNSDLKEKIKKKEFREDLLARIDAFHFPLPDLKSRLEDIEPNLNREIQKFSIKNNINLTINDKARARYLEFAMSREATWNNNFRDLTASVIRMGAYAENGRITLKIADEEIKCLRDRWNRSSPELERFPLTHRFLGEDGINNNDLVDLVQMEVVIGSCLSSRNQAEAGRKLYSASIAQKTSKNDSDRLRKYLEKNGLAWETIKATTQ
ncbi:MAG: RNA repair transcriptional activator RtcR family protein [Pyrinomonadaceae bacterium]